MTGRIYKSQYLPFWYRTVLYSDYTNITMPSMPPVTITASEQSDYNRKLITIMIFLMNLL